VQQVGQYVTCTATVKDVDTNGAKSPPQGMVTFSKALGDSGTFSPNATCTLNASVVAGDTNTCSVQYTSATPTVDVLSATYNGSDVHKTSMTDANAPLFVPFYDPAGGFVTGGGWFNSPAGAYRADPTLTGKANFGFVSKYQKGQSTPNGQTEFQFHAGSLNFHSEAYQWLVVSANNSKAQYKGTGEINGVSGYGFLVTAWDVNPDRFRIKIWKLSDGSIVYDNNYGSSDDIDTAPLQIASGSIVIHK
jgi:hypothetical protein